MTMSERPTFPRIEEMESTNPDFERELFVSVGGDQQHFSYRFFYKVEGNAAKLLGQPAGGGSSIALDDEHFSSLQAQRGSDALKIAVHHIHSLNPQIEAVEIRPEILKIAGLYVAWNTRGENIYLKDVEADEKVIRTNAEITTEEFQKLSQARGKLIRMTYRHHQRYSDEEPSSDSTIDDEFLLEDFNYVEDPNTGIRYLAFLRSPKNTLFPFFVSESTFDDQSSVTISKVVLIETGEELWSFANQGLRIRIDKLGSDNIIERIKSSSKSYSASRQ